MNLRDSLNQPEPEQWETLHLGPADVARLDQNRAAISELIGRDPGAEWAEFVCDHGE